MRSMRMAMPLAVLTLAGCATAPEGYDREKAASPDTEKALLADKPAPAHRLYRQVLAQGSRNMVLNQSRVGVAALELDADAAAGASLDSALQSVEAIYAENEKAALARSTFVKENYKDFKGESYERSMVFYYRGIVDLRAGDYENARAAFRSAMFQDTFAEDQRYAADTAAFAFLAGWAAKCGGSPALAREDFAEAASINGKLRPPADDHNLLMVAELGRAPVKYSVGRYNEYLSYERGSGFRERAATFQVGDVSHSAVPAEDLYFQASTRGGTQVAFVRESKAIFRHDTEQVAQVMTTIGASTAMVGALSGNRGAAYAGLAILAVGLIAEGVAAATTPQADIRYWDNLPDTIALSTARVALEPKDGEGARLRREAGQQADEAAALDLRAAATKGPRRAVLTAQAEEARSRSVAASEAAAKADADELAASRRAGIPFAATFHAEDGSELPDLRKTGIARFPGNCAIAWVRSRSALDVEDRAPNSSTDARSTARGPQGRS